MRFEKEYFKALILCRREDTDINRIRKQYQKRINTGELMTLEDIKEELESKNIKVTDEDLNKMFNNLVYSKISISMQELIKKINPQTCDGYFLDRISQKKMAPRFKEFFIQQFPCWENTVENNQKKYT